MPERRSEGQVLVQAQDVMDHQGIDARQRLSERVHQPLDQIREGGADVAGCEFGGQRLKQRAARAQLGQGVQGYAGAKLAALADHHTHRMAVRDEHARVGGHGNLHAADIGRAGIVQDRNGTQRSSPRLIRMARSIKHAADQANIGAALGGGSPVIGW